MLDFVDGLRRDFGIDRHLRHGLTRIELLIARCRRDPARSVGVSLRQRRRVCAVRPRADARQEAHADAVAEQPGHERYREPLRRDPQP